MLLNLTLLQMAEECGLMSLNPSDLVFESNSAVGISYYDYVLSARQSHDSWHLYLCKFDSRTNVESMHTLIVRKKLLDDMAIPCDCDLQLMTLGILVWKQQLTRARLLCLLDAECPNSAVPALEALKRAAKKFKCSHHVLTLNANRPSNSSDIHHQLSSRRRSASSMQLRVMMCQTRTSTTDISNQALRETKCLLVPSSNPILCLCFPIT